MLMTATRLATRLRQWRIDAGLSLAEMSGLTGYSSAMISRAERGERVFSPRAKVMLARALGVAVSDLFEPGTNGDEAA
jgi:transcriptional regulator with XRE-family HTH domain